MAKKSEHQVKLVGVQHTRNFLIPEGRVTKVWFRADSEDEKDVIKAVNKTPGLGYGIGEQVRIYKVHSNKTETYMFTLKPDVRESHGQGAHAAKKPLVVHDDDWSNP